MIKVLQVFTMMDRGGSESMIMNYYRKIDREKIQFDFLVHRKEKCDFDDEIESLGGKIYRLSSINPIFPGKYYEELRAFFKTHTEYTIIHSHLNTFSCFPIKIAKEFTIPIRIVHAHIAIEKIKFSDLVPSKENLIDTVKKLIKFRLKNKNRKDATHYFSCGDKAGRWLFGKNTEFLTMNNAIDTEKFVFDPKTRKEYRKELGVEDKFVIGHVGRLDTQKNHVFLIQIFARIIEKHPNAKLMLVGEGPLREKIAAEAKRLGVEDDVMILGVRSDIPELLQAFDSFVFPSFYEGLPVTLIEAQAAGLKIFASDTITTEVSLTNDIEFLSIKDTAEFWANKVVKAMSYTRINNKPQIVKGGYDIISNTKRIEEFYLQQINH